MAFEHQEPCEQDPNDAGMSHLGDARRRPIAFGTAVMFMMSFVLSACELTSSSHAGATARGTAPGAAGQAGAEPTPHFPAQFDNQATEIKPHVEAF